MSTVTKLLSKKSFGGCQEVYSHESTETGCKMNFSIYLPPQCKKAEKLPVIYWLSGLTCNEMNFVEKAGAQRVASENGVIIVCPDTSPRGLNIPGDSNSWDFGVGAGFYIDATEEPWSKHYRMYSYITKELINVINKNFPVAVGKQSIMGHSMGGHGALICALKNPGLYKSVSAFAPISNPCQCPWGDKAFNGYFGPTMTSWQEWDASHLVKKYNGPLLELKIDQGTQDDFYIKKQLLPENLVQACKEANMPAVLTMRDGYDHSYYFIASFIEEHIKYHVRTPVIYFPANHSVGTTRH